MEKCEFIMSKKIKLILWGILGIGLVILSGVWLCSGTQTFSDAAQNVNFQEYKIGNKISFEQFGNSQKYTGSGWSQPEKKFTWTDGKDAYLNMFIKNANDKKLQLNVFGHGIFAAADECQKVTVYANGSELTTWCVLRDDDHYTVEIPENLIKDGSVQIKLHIDKPFVPKSDPRHLGFSVKTVHISQMFAAKTKIKIAKWIKNKILKISEEPGPENTSGN